MNIIPDPNFDLSLLNNDRIMGIDVGSHTLGIAFTYLGLSSATPHCVIQRNKYKNDLIALNLLIKDWDIKGLVFGLPLNMDGSHGARVQATKTIARNIARDTTLPYCLIDERLSTSAATDRLISLGVRPSNRKNVIDSHAATIILENYQNFLHNRHINSN
ncbi:MAG: putative Holliday junction resolvase [Alphaproteobacteria bacterium]|jgi:putative Holliday junction resolvase